MAAGIAVTAGLALRVAAGAGDGVRQQCAERCGNALQEVGWPVAVGMPYRAAQAVGTVIAPTNNEDGVAKTVEKYVLAEDTAEVAHGELIFAC